MTSSISWIDRAGLAETLARLEPGTFKRSAARRPRSAPLAPLPEPILDVDALPARDAFSPPAGQLHEKLEAFVDWLLEVEGGRVAFVIDRDGLPLVDRGADADLLAIASSIMQLIERINRRLMAAVGRFVTVQLEEGQLILIAVTTSIGEYTVGHVDRRAPDTTMRLAVAKALQAAFSSEERLTLR